MEQITIFTAGRTRGNPGPAAVGVYVVDAEGTVVLEHSAKIGNAVHDFADYQAVATALETVVEHYEEKTTGLQFELKLDSELVKKQLNNEDQITDPSLASHFIYVHNLIVEHFPNLIFTLITPEQNTVAAQLVDEALDGR